MVGINSNHDYVVSLHSYKFLKFPYYTYFEPLPVIFCFKIDLCRDKEWQIGKKPFF